VVSVVGLIGWVVTHKGAPPPATVTKNIAPPDKISSAAAPKSNENDQAAALSIKEWGVKIPLSSVDLGAYYKLSDSIEQSPSDPTNFVIYSKEADAIAGPTGKSCKGEYVANIMRLPSDDPKWQPSANVFDGNISPLYVERTVVGKYRYAVETKKQYGPECFETSASGDYKTDEATEKKFTDIVNAFVSDFKNITAN
jgi:hypothetical protein